MQETFRHDVQGWHDEDDDLFPSCSTAALCAARCERLFNASCAVRTACT